MAWTLAYALVLQFVLTSSLLASRAHEARGGYEICINDVSMPSDPASGSDEGAKSFVHCPSCLPRAEIGVLPVPPKVPGVEGLGSAVAFDGVVPRQPRLWQERSAHRPRGPPARA